MSDAAKTGRLDLSSLQSAVQALGNTLDINTAHKLPLADPHWRDPLVSSVMQRFEFTAELCWKILQRQLEQEFASPTMLDSMNYRDLIRLGHERRLIENVPIWLAGTSRCATPN